MSDQVADAAEIDIIRPEITAYTVDKLELTAQPERLQIQTRFPEEESAIRDLFCGIFGLLPETPARAVGINRHMHFRVADTDTWHRIGHAVVPERLWSPHMTDVGMLSTVIRGNARGEGRGRLQITVQPSSQIQPGVYVSYNEHFETEDEMTGLSTLLDDFERNWERSQRDARSLAETVLQECLSESPS